MEQLGSHWTDFLEIRYFSIFRKSVVELSIFITIGQELWVLYLKTDVYFLSYLAQFFFE